MPQITLRTALPGSVLSLRAFVGLVSIIFTLGD